MSLFLHGALSCSAAALFGASVLFYALAGREPGWLTVVTAFLVGAQLALFAVRWRQTRA